MEAWLSRRGVVKGGNVLLWPGGQGRYIGVLAGPMAVRAGDPERPTLGSSEQT